MKTLKKEQCDLLMQIISTHYPNQQILHLTDGCNNLHQALFEFTKTKGHEYDLRMVNTEINDLPIQEHNDIFIKPLDINAKVYNQHSKKYENIFVTLNPEYIEADSVGMFKKFFRIMKNAGVVVILIPKGEPLLDTIDKELEDSYFVAINHIDIFDDYDVVTAKKLHGWGAYQVGF
ncbi:hypothetical protein RZR97_06615 [Hydrogenimonas thermophila]|uniref:hypothetical protein n=1 Tax=Hydrogenimonas thermophila TaxID=223786 RepID=UPI002936E6B1|nr:hypothetical protein [Hydrogenimonas thermophila]WOE68789.1 hypothetical protein RZR91_06635 [Hydrogenimonas thermophila]WOE71299.1 hypothetical protein RZR97_06615 [Hydrogenimonas thermophila]